MSARRHRIHVTTHEWFVLTLYRSSTGVGRRTVDGLLYGCLCTLDGTARFVDMGRWFAHHLTTEELLRVRGYWRALQLRVFVFPPVTHGVKEEQ